MLNDYTSRLKKSNNSKHKLSYIRELRSNELEQEIAKCAGNWKYH